jgi:Family of unknown function (DUF6522)
MVGTRIIIEKGSVEIDARLVAEALDLEASEFMMLVRSGHITSLCESGVGADEGHFRLTFFFRGKRLRLIVDRCGHQTRKTMIDFGDRPLPSKLRVLLRNSGDALLYPIFRDIGPRGRPSYGPRDRSRRAFSQQV